jgi:hypothetical protein
MVKTPERKAWISLLAAFSIFVVLVVSIPIGVRCYLLSATQSEVTQLEVISGTILIHSPGQPAPNGVTDVAQVIEQAEAKTDETSWGTLTFFDESSAVMYSKTELQILETRTPRFQISSQPDLIKLWVSGGRVRLAVAPVNGRERLLEVHTPHAVAKLNEGSYSVEVSNKETEIAVREGQAIVSGSGGVREINKGERTNVAISQPPTSPVAAARDLVLNGNFRDGLNHWSVYNEQGVDGGVVNGQAEVILSNDRYAVRLARMGEDGNHCETGIVQDTYKDVRDFDSLKLHADVQLLYQSLSGGGYLSSEFPIILRIDYKDQYGIDRFWTHGFYYQNEANFPVQNGTNIPRYRWYPYETDNLMDELGNLRPTWITSIRIYASGWNYQSMVSEVGLIVE